MKSSRLALLAAAATAVSVASAQPAAPSPAAATPAAPITLQDALTKGKVSFNARLRYESVEMDPLSDAEALTLRLRLGYLTGVYHGFQAFVEGEHISAADEDYSDGTGPNPGNYAVIADPELSQINQAWLAYSYGKTKATVGRQRIVLDNARFVGDVGWRQNQQTFDAVVVTDKTVQDVSLTYGYVRDVNRIFDDSFTQPNFDSDSHLFNAAYSGLKAGTLTAYGYLLDFEGGSTAPVALGVKNNSTATFGLSFAGSAKLTDDVSLLYRAEYATQTDYGSSQLDYSSDYYLGEIGAKFLKNYTASLGYEVLGSDDGKLGSGFKTPLATLHAYNGWADKFLVTPSDGLTDTYFKTTATLPYDLSFLGFYHFFGTTDGAGELGRELDLQLIYKFNAQLSFTAKAAFFEADNTAAVVPGANRDTEKFWLQAEYAF